MTVPTQERPTRDPEAGDRVRVKPAIDPRIRERRIEVLREAGRRRLRITLAIASTIVVVGLVYLVLRSPLLDLDHIRITGNRQERAGEVMRAAGVHTGDALMFVDSGAVARRVERLPWVAGARVDRELPGTLSIAVKEFVATAYARVSPKEVALVASNGRVIAHAKSAPPGVVEVIGLRAIPAAGHRISQPAAADVVRRLPAGLSWRVRAVDVAHDDVVLDLSGAAPAGNACGGAGTALAGPKQIRLGTFGDLENKGPAALAVRDHLAEQPFSYIDVSAPKTPVSC